jgi:hypothetical protein
MLVFASRRPEGSASCICVSPTHRSALPPFVILICSWAPFCGPLYQHKFLYAQMNNRKLPLFTAPHHLRHVPAGRPLEGQPLVSALLSLVRRLTPLKCDVTPYIPSRFSSSSSGYRRVNMSLVRHEGFWIDGWIYWTLTIPDYNSLQLYFSHSALHYSTHLVFSVGSIFTSPMVPVSKGRLSLSSGARDSVDALRPYATSLKVAVSSPDKAIQHFQFP